MARSGPSSVAASSACPSRGAPRRNGWSVTAVRPGDRLAERPGWPAACSRRCPRAGPARRACSNSGGASLAPVARIRGRNSRPDRRRAVRAGRVAHRRAGRRRRGGPADHRRLASVRSGGELQIAGPRRSARRSSRRSGRGVRGGLLAATNWPSTTGCCCTALQRRAVERRSASSIGARPCDEPRPARRTDQIVRRRRARVGPALWPGLPVRPVKGEILRLRSRPGVHPRARAAPSARACTAGRSTWCRGPTASSSARPSTRRASTRGHRRRRA